MRPWILSETNFAHVKDCDYQVAVLPMGATEPHNLHLPYGTDTLEADAIASRVCEAAWNRGAKVVMLPAIRDESGQMSSFNESESDDTWDGHSRSGGIFGWARNSQSVDTKQPRRQ